MAEGGQVTAALAEAPVAIGSAAGRLGHRPTGPPVGQPAVQPGHPALLGLPFGDTQCGLKGFRRYAALEVFGRARLDGFAFDAEVRSARRLGLVVSEVRPG